MLEPRIYRAAFVPVLLAVLVVAFSLSARPRGIGTTLAPDAFDGVAAAGTLAAYARAFPDRRPGSPGDEALAARVARDLRRLGGTVTTSRSPGRTVDGTRELTTVVATRPGGSAPGLVVVAHRDALGAPATAELSGTAALVELARVAGAGRLRRTITLVSTSGGSGGLAGARTAVARLPRPVDAVLVLGDLASERLRKPWVVGFSNGGGAAPQRLRRTVEAAVRAETGQDPGGVRAGAQWARFALPMTLGEQGAFGDAGLASVLLSGTGERPPAARAPVSRQRLTVFGRSALRAISALDNGPDVRGGPEELLVTQRKALPSWAIRVLVGTALLPVWLGVLDGLARVRRRKLGVGAAVRWALACAAPFALVGLFVVGLGLLGLLGSRPAAPVPAGAAGLDARAAGVLVAAVLVFALGWVGVRPVARQAAHGEPPGDEHAAAALGVLAAVTLVVWVLNPFAAALLVLPAHFWLLAAVREVRTGRRAASILLLLLALAPLALAVRSLARQLGYGPGEAVWSTVLMVAGGHVGPLAWLGWALVGGAGVAVALLVLRRAPEEREPVAATLRGPRTYAGPGSLGGTDSALRR